MDLIYSSSKARIDVLRNLVKACLKKKSWSMVNDIIKSDERVYFLKKRGFLYPMRIMVEQHFVSVDSELLRERGIKYSMYTCSGH